MSEKNKYLYYAEFGEGDETFSLSEDESTHCLKVLRQKEGDFIVVTNGKGLLVNGEIVVSYKKGCLIKKKFLSVQKKERDYVLNMAISPLKTVDRFEMFVEKAIEIGVDRITPLICSNTERKRVNAERLERIAVSALKQSFSAYLPIMEDAVGFEDFVGRNFEGVKAIAHCFKTKRENFRDIVRREREITVMIGPEADFTVKEIDLAMGKGFVPVVLTGSRLRSETAGIFAAVAANLRI